MPPRSRPAWPRCGGASRRSTRPRRTQTRPRRTQPTLRLKALRQHPGGSSGTSGRTIRGVSAPLVATSQHVRTHVRGGTSRTRTFRRSWFRRRGGESVLEQRTRGLRRLRHVEGRQELRHVRQLVPAARRPQRIIRRRTKFRARASVAERCPLPSSRPAMRTLDVVRPQSSRPAIRTLEVASARACRASSSGSCSASAQIGGTRIEEPRG